MAQPEIAVVQDFAAVIGEAPLWSPRDRTLYWVDTIQKKILRLRAPFTHSEIRDLPYRPSCLALLEDGGLLIGYRKGIGIFDFESGLAKPLPLDGMDFEDLHFNDGICDRAGRLWIGTGHRDAIQPIGGLFCMDAGLTPRPVLDRIVLSNGMGWSPDGRILYHANSRPGRIDAHDFDVATGTLSNRRTFIDYAGRGRRPDGCTTDAEGYLWVAEIDGWRIARYAPDGSLDREIMLPVQRPTSLMFGGDDLSTLFVTSMRFTLDAAALAAQPHAGMLMALRPGVRGMEEAPFRGLTLAALDA